MKTKLIITFLIIVLISSYLLVFQRSRLKTSVKILLSQLRNSEWISGENFGYKYRLAPPANLNPTDSSKKYPLVIYLHGASERGSDNRLQIYDITYLGAGGKDKYNEYQSKYPSFVYMPQCPRNETWNDQNTLAGMTKTITNLMKKYPIDQDRIYLIGYSMGGSGSYALAEHYYQTTKQNFAGIIRLTGQSQFDQKTHEIISRSSVWLHVGLQDAPIRVQAAETAFQKLKDLLPEAVESSKDITITNHPGITRTLTVNGREIAKLSEYTNDAHGISEFPFYDSYLLEWLFSRSTQK